MPEVTPQELRDLSRRLREVAAEASDLKLKRQLGQTALALAQLAEEMKRRGGERQS